MEESTDLVYFSSASENTRRFIEKLHRPATRIPLRPRVEGMIRVTRPFVLITPSYGGGSLAGAVPKQVGAFLNDPVNRSLMRGVITSGNTNFGEHFCIAGPLIAKKCKVPELYRFELLGTARDVERVNAGLDEFWAELARTHPEAVALPEAVAIPEAAPSTNTAATSNTPSQATPSTT
nr:class Ib ribonucleoside-diphosphate reductase assembly flavoprotein NrdI [Corynebacterium spheniscorum]